MRSATPGRSTSQVEVTNVSPHGFWLLLGTEELFVSFSDFPWFRDAAIGQLQKVRLLHSEHLFWPDLDVDLVVDSIEHPERYPLLSRAGSNKALQPSGGAGKVAESPSHPRRATRR